MDDLEGRSARRPTRSEAEPSEGWARPLERRLVITCEHASNRIPARYRNLGLPRARLASHVAWDPGARQVAAQLARRFRVPLVAARVSRLVADANRSLHHPRLIPRVAFGVAIPGNAGLSPTARAGRIDRYWRPYRRRVVRSVRGRIARFGFCLHLSVHSFTPRLHGRTRRADVGLLYDPGRSAERRLAAALLNALAHTGLRVRRNYPYRGTSNGLVPALRRMLPESRYLGLELELNQARLRDAAGRRRLARLLGDALAAL